MASASATASRDRLVAELEAIARAATQGRAPELSGVYVTPSNLSRLDGILCLQASFYKGAIFRFTLELPPTYPRAPPTVRFVAGTVRHPLVTADGTLRLVGEHLDPWEPEALGAAPLAGPWRRAAEHLQQAAACRPHIGRRADAAEQLWREALGWQVVGGPSHR